MSQKIIMLKGLPGCGKSTYAKERMKTSQRYVRVNKDLLREMMNFSVYTPDNEVGIKEAQLEVVIAALSRGKSVIIDDTNLGEKYWKYWNDVANDNDVGFEIVDLMEDVDVKECIRRNEERVPHLDSSIIKRMAKEHGYK